MIDKTTGTSSLSTSYKVKDNLLTDYAFLKIYSREDLLASYTPEGIQNEI